MTEERRSRFRKEIGFVIVALVLVLAFLAVLAYRHTQLLNANEDKVINTLLEIVEFERAFRDMDSEGNGLRDYWTADVTGCSMIEVWESCCEQKMLPPAVAEADAAPLEEADWRWRPPPSPRPWKGYFYVIMLKDGEGNSYQQDPDGDGHSWTHKTKFAYCAFPAQYGWTGKNTFIVSEKNIVYRKNIGGNMIRKWPGEDPAQLGWHVYNKPERKPTRQYSRFGFASRLIANVSGE